ncbi:MAG TPA: ABC transporter permease [Vicinamibacterales bacterium]|nr:ABC transporter permease [Vicinamibacterales bacterium]
MESFLRDVSFALRSLKRQPAFAITAVLTIALGIGATSAIFSVVNAVLLRPLPYSDAARLGTVWSDLRARNVTDFPLPPGDFFDLRKDTTLFDGFAAITSFRPTIGGDGSGDSEQVNGGAVTTNFFTLLGHRIHVGRNFVEEDGTPNPAPPQGENLPPPGAQPPPPLPNIAIISYEFWQRRYGGNESIVGKSIEFGNGRADIVGVLAPNFEILFPPGTSVDPRPDILIASRVNYETGSRNNVSLRVVAKLKPGVSVQQAQSELDRLSADLRSRFPIKQTSDMNIRIEPMHDDLVADVRPQLVALMGAVVFVLLIACANVANLLLVRASARERELAVRAAIGGNRWRIVRQLVAESLVLAAIGGGAGLLLAQFGIDALIQLSPEGLPRASAVSLDGNVLLFTAIASFSAALIFGVLPAWKASRPDVMDVLRSSGRLVGGGAGRWLRDGAVVAEVALAFVLLVGSGLMIRTFIALQNANPGFDPSNVMTFLIQNNRAQGVEGRQAFQRTMLERLKAIPGVVDATSAGPIPLDGGNSLARFGPVEAATDPAKFQQAIAHFVQPGYFEFTRTPVIAGRTFTAADNRRDVKVIIIDDLMAAQLFPNGNAVGQRMLARVTTPEPDTFEVVGVVKHQRHTTMMNDGEEGMFFTDGYAQFGAAFRWAVRTSGPPEAITGAIRSAMAEQDRRLLMTEPRTWQSYMDEHIAPTRFALILIGVFAGVAAILAMIGLYGVLATTVRQRTTEIGVRVAFGATYGRILKLIIGQGLRLSAAGIVLGVVAAIALTRVMASLLVGVTATDPMTFATMAIVFAIVATFAAWIPARRAAALNPNVALRDE